MPALRPSPGFCLQTDSSHGKGAKWYLNMCRHRAVEMPLAPNGKPVDREHILSRGLGNLQVPFDMGTFRKLKQRADGANRTTYCVDVVFSPLIIQLFMDDNFCNSMETFRQFVMNLAINRVEQTIGVKLAPHTMHLVKSLRYKDGEEGDDTLPREFAEIAGESMDGEMGTDQLYPQKPAAPPTQPEPLIEDVTAPRRQKPAIKKGFLNGRKETQSLYDKGGSGEGVLPENAGDPMGWMPKKLRQNSKIVDCNSPDWQKYEKEKKAAEEHNKMNADFKDMLSKDLQAYTKFQARDKWEEDLPDGTEAPVVSKYSVDYSRFADIPDVDDDAKVEERDWYYDANGVRREKGRGTAAQPAAGADAARTLTTPTAEPAVKKGFLKEAKSSLYPTGSAEAKAQAHPSEADMMKQLGSMMGDMGSLGDLGDLGDLADLLPPLPSAKTDSAETQKPKVAVKRPEMKDAEFTMTSDSGGLQLVVLVPGLSSMRDVNLDVTERQADLAFPSGCSLRPLKVELPKAVVPTSVKAKFSKKSQQITITLPTAA